MKFESRYESCYIYLSSRRDKIENKKKIRNINRRIELIIMCCKLYMSKRTEHAVCQILTHGRESLGRKPKKGPVTNREIYFHSDRQTNSRTKSPSGKPRCT